ncbi:MAG: TolC family protein [Leptolyngbyaceae cyanobacterium]
MLSPWFIRIQFGLAIAALPAASWLGWAESADASAARPSATAAKASLAKTSTSERSRQSDLAITARPQASVEAAVSPVPAPDLARASALPLSAIAAAEPSAPVMPASEPVAPSPAPTPEVPLASPENGSPALVAIVSPPPERLLATDNIKPQPLKSPTPRFSLSVSQASPAIGESESEVSEADDSGILGDGGEVDNPATDGADASLPTPAVAQENEPAAEDEDEVEVFSPLPDTAPDEPAQPAERRAEPAAEEEDLPAADEIDSSPPAEEATPAVGESDADIPIPDEQVLDELQFLEPDPNPLLIQTTPEEIEIIGSQPLSLEQAVELAYRNNPDLRVVLLELEQNEAALREAQAANFPTVSVSGNLQGQNTTTTGGGGLTPTADGGFSFDTSTSEELGVSYSAQIDVVYNIFSSGQRQATIEAAAEQVQLALLEVERRQEELRLDTANEYYDLQTAIESIRISQAFLEEAERNLQDTELREEVGVGTRFDVLRAQVQVANARQDLVNAERSRQVAQRTLARRLNVPPSLTITTLPVNIAGTWSLGLEESIVLAYQNRAELEQQLTQRDVNEALRRAELSVLGPQVDLFANYNLSDVLTQEDSFSDNYAFGAQVSWTLFEGGAARARARQRELDIEIAERNFEETRNTVRLGVESAFFNLQSNQTNIDTARLAVTQAQEALDLANLRFDAGVGTQLDILNAQSELTDAEVNLVQAIIGYNRSLAELERAVSNLPESYYEEIPY